MLFLLLSIIVIVFLYLQNNFFIFEKFEINTNKLDKDSKIIHLSDIHGKKIPNFVINKIRNLNPSAICISGDGIDNRRGGFENLFNLCSQLNSFTQIYYSLGNHEKRLTDLDNFINKLESLGVIVLCNNGLYDKTLNLNFVGINDPSFRNYDLCSKEVYIKNNFYKNIWKLNKNSFTLLICHRPEIFNIYASLKIDLALSGHGHGGQFRIPFIGGVFTPSEGLFPKYDSGIYTKENFHLIVSPGIGNSTFPFRLNNPPKIMVINLLKG